ncbi:MAG: ThuA domain-containing protein [Acidimicrobiia bacterium]
MRHSLIIGGVVVGLVACSEPATQLPPSSVSATSLSTSETTTSTAQATTSTTLGPLQVLVFHKTAGFRHDSIPAGTEAITALSEEHGFVVTATDDASVFTQSRLADYEVIVFLSTTGDILDASQEQAMENFIQSGNGFVGIHSATDTEYEWAWYGDLVGAYFDGHPAPQPATVHVVEPDHPTMEGLPLEFERFDEWYNFMSLPGAGVMVLATVEETTYEGGTMDELHPITWAQEFDGGRSFYTAMGHTVESFSEPLFRTLVGNAILWAAGVD